MILPSVEALTMLPEENRQEALEWMASQPPSKADENVDPISRWEIRIGLGGLANFYYVYDRETKQTKQLQVNIENW